MAEGLPTFDRKIVSLASPSAVSWSTSSPARHVSSVSRGLDPSPEAPAVRASHRQQNSDTMGRTLRATLDLLTFRTGASREPTTDASGPGSGYLGTVDESPP